MFHSLESEAVRVIWLCSLWHPSVQGFSLLILCDMMSSAGVLGHIHSCPGLHAYRLDNLKGLGSNRQAFVT